MAVAKNWNAKLDNKTHIEFIYDLLSFFLSDVHTLDLIVTSSGDNIHSS